MRMSDPRPVRSERLLQIAHRLDLRRPHARGDEFRHLRKPRPQLLIKADHAEQFFRAVEREDFAAARVGVEVVSEPRGLAGRLVAEWERSAVTWQTLRQSFEVFARLRLDAGKRGAFLLRFHDTDHFRVGVEQVIGEPGGERELADGDAGASGDVVRAIVLDQPSGLGEELVDPLAGLVFGLHRAPMRTGKEGGEVT
jgi:hypothetical protein